ncbi:MAG: phthalyl amidase [Deltaproteobacteria bacterium]|nr:MAG: phthalyl amidase [Deltaproteobacteria bacterium]
MRHVHPFRWLVIAAVLIVSMLLVVGSSAPADVGGGSPPAWFVDESKLPFTALPGATAYYGVLAGAGFRAEVPANWNGDLVVWDHGFRGTGLELTVDNHPLRPLLISLGFAWAASSYSRNDYDISSGVQSTLALVKHLNGLIGNPRRVYLTGASLGGHVTAASIEQYRNVYTAALPICGVVADYALFDYFLDFNVAAQQLGTGTSQFPVDPVHYITVTVPQIKANLSAVPGGWPNVLNANGQNLKNLVELRSGGERPNFDQAWFFWNTFPSFASGPGNFLFDLGTGNGTLPRAPGVGVDNHDVVYQFDSDPSLSAAEQAFNDGVVRVTADPQALAGGLRQVPQISGDITIPVLTLHNLGDLFVPFLNEVEYAKRVAAHGKSDLLVQRAIRGVSHCDFTAAEFSRAFLDLVNWVQTGVRPPGDDVIDPAAVAQPNFGCTFTQGSHLLGVPCP